MTLREFFADLIMAVHACYSLFVIVGFLLVIAGMIFAGDGPDIVGFGMPISR